MACNRKLLIKAEQAPGSWSFKYKEDIWECKCRFKIELFKYGISRLPTLGWREKFKTQSQPRPSQPCQYEEVT